MDIDREESFQLKLEINNKKKKEKKQRIIYV